MDLRYRETKGIRGALRLGPNERRRDALVRNYLAQARRLNHQAQAYGGSTGGISSSTPPFQQGLRAAGYRDQRKLFEGQRSEEFTNYDPTELLPRWRRQTIAPDETRLRLQEAE